MKSKKYDNVSNSSDSSGEEDVSSGEEDTGSEDESIGEGESERRNIRRRVGGSQKSAAKPNAYRNRKSGGQYLSPHSCLDIMRDPFSTADQVIACVNDDNTHMRTWNELLEMADRVPEDTMIMRRASVKAGAHLQCRLNPRPMNRPYCMLNKQPIGTDSNGLEVDEFYYYVDLLARDRRACFNIDSIDSWRQNRVKFIDPYNNKVIMHSRLVGALLNSQQVPYNLKVILQKAYAFEITDYKVIEKKNKRRQSSITAEADGRYIKQRTGGRSSVKDEEIAEAILAISEQLSASKLKSVVELL